MVTTTRGTPYQDLSGNSDPAALTGSLDDGAARDAFVVTKSDTTIFDTPVRGLYIGGTGNVNVRLLNGEQCLFSAVPVGTIIPIACKGVMSTSTTATNIVALV